MTFIKGHSGNPGGKPKELKSIQLAARAISPLALRELKRILNDPQAGKQAKIAAAIAVWDRAYGKPKQELTQDVTVRGDSLAEALEKISKADRVINDLASPALTERIVEREQALTSNN